jgi:hypothetical protein
MTGKVCSQLLQNRRSRQHRWRVSPLVPVPA